MTAIDRLLEQLTREALEAAKEGKWDQVANLYDRRASGGQLEQASPEIARKLVKWDQWLIARTREVQAATQQNLVEVQDRRRKLDILKRQWGGTASVQARHLLSV